MHSPQIVGLGGFPQEPMLEYVFGLARGRRVLYVPTASNEDPARTVEWYERLRGRAELTPLSFTPWPPADLRASTELREIVTTQPGAGRYEVDADGERPLGERAPSPELPKNGCNLVVRQPGC